MKINFTKHLKTAGALFLFFILAYVSMSGLAYVGYVCIRKVKPSTIYIPTGSTLEQQAALLVEYGSIKDTTEFLNYVRKFRHEDFKPGKYVLDKKISYSRLLKLLAEGRQTPVRLTFTPSRTIGDVSAKIARNIECDSMTIDSLLHNNSMARRYGFDSLTFTVMLVPNTYEVYWNISVDELFEKLHKEYDIFWSKNNREALLAQMGMTKQEVVTLASIVYEESKIESDMRKIAGVYINRLRIGMRLQADPTCKYAVGDWTIKRVMKGHTAVNSPYNTYLVAGLPPGPIVIPSIAAIDAVLNYDKSKNIYFCASPDFDGTHLFSPTLDAHNKIVRAFRKACQARQETLTNQ
ncbi:MAG: endolytic transglycosylase MltG [Rikenellaceae bacterium]